MLAFSPETERLVNEFFAEQTCCECRQAAGRFWRERFYCYACYDEKFVRPFAEEDCRVHRVLGADRLDMLRAN